MAAQFNNTDQTNLTGKVLIAMPGMADPRFAQSVVLICAHGDEGAMGIVLNKPLPGVAFAELLDQLGIAPDRARQRLESNAPELPSWAGELRLSGIRAFDGQWDAVVDRGRVRMEAVK